MKNTNRALRRHHNERMIQKALRSQLMKTWWFDQEDTLEERHQQAKRLSNNLADCSCAMCGNPRSRSTYGKGDDCLTLAERINNINFIEQLTEVDLQVHKYDTYSDIWQENDK